MWGQVLSERILIGGAELLGCLELSASALMLSQALDTSYFGSPCLAYCQRLWAYDISTITGLDGQMLPRLKALVVEVLPTLECAPLHYFLISNQHGLLRLVDLGLLP